MTGSNSGPSTSVTSAETSPRRTRQLTSADPRVPNASPHQGFLQPPYSPAGLLQTVKNTHGQWYLPDINPTERNGEVRRVTLEQTPSGYTIKELNQSRYYPTIAHLIAAHCSQTNSLPCLLRLPGYSPASIGPSCVGTSATGSPTGVANFSMRNRLAAPLNGASGALGECPSTTPIQRSWTKRIGSREMTDPWADKAIIPPVPPHRTPNTNSQIRKQLQRPVYSLLPQGAGLLKSSTTDLGYLKNFPNFRWKSLELYNEGIVESKIFGFVAINQVNPSGSPQCHLFCEYDLNEPANVICDFTNRYLNLLNV
ncbi:unnamed protein product [Echinostoma caproni]|uniref:PTB domain-containing protein n=1 Tax=Echinostoma caproni TaxID=27848 RepID=A0A183A7V1_9TREM|nr:unnamed protein product [Echinostoma caproni]